MRLTIITFIFLILSTFAFSQSVAEQLLSNEYEAACGKPLADGKVYDYRAGRITSVTKDNVLVFRQRELNGDEKVETIGVQLAGIGVKTSSSLLNNFLRKNMVGKDVVIAGNKRTVSDTSLIGSVWTSSIGDVNQYLLRNRIAAFLEPEYRAVSGYSICVLKQIADEPR